MTDTVTNPENVTTSAESDDAITARENALTWTFMESVGLSNGALAEIARECKEQRDKAMVLPDWKRRRHNLKRG